MRISLNKQTKEKLLTPLSELFNEANVPNERSRKIYITRFKDNGMTFLFDLAIRTRRELELNNNRIADMGIAIAEQIILEHNIPAALIREMLDNKGLIHKRRDDNFYPPLYDRAQVIDALRLNNVSHQIKYSDEQARLLPFSATPSQPEGKPEPSPQLNLF